MGFVQVVGHSDCFADLKSSEPGLRVLSRTPCWILQSAEGDVQVSLGPDCVGCVFVKA